MTPSPLPSQDLLAFEYTTLSYTLFSYAYFAVWIERLYRSRRKWETECEEQ